MCPTDILGARLREARHAIGLRQMDLAVKAEIHMSYLSSIERGVAVPSLEVLGRLLDATDLTWSAFFDGLTPRQIVDVCDTVAKMKQQ